MDGYIGEIKLFGGNFAPRDWQYCNGQLLPINEYTSLYAIIGTFYGGDGHTTVGLPDLRGRCVIGAGHGPGLSNYPLGAKVGAETVTLTSAQMPAHTHNAVPNLTGKIRCNDQLSDHESPVGNTLAVFKEDKNAFNTQAPDADMHDNTLAIEGSVTLENSGGNQAHANIQPSLGLNYIICVNGLFPQRS